MHAGWTATKVCSAVNSISEQINLFKCQNSVCVSVCKLRKLLVYYVTFAFSRTVLWVLKYKIVVIVYCDVVNILPHFNFCDEIIILNAWAIFKNCLQKGMVVGNFCSCSTIQCLWLNLPCVPLYDHPVITATSSRLKLTHTPRIAFRHLPPNSARTGHATEGAHSEHRFPAPSSKPVSYTHLTLPTSYAV